MFTLSLVLVAAVTIALYIYQRVRNLKSEPTAGGLATLKSLISGWTWTDEQEYKLLYDQNSTAKVVKSNSSFRPVFVLRDPHLIENVLIRDFEYFTNRAHKGNSKELFDLDGDVWSSTKRKCLPVFSREHLEGMFEYFTGNLGTLVTRVSQATEGNADVGEPLKMCVSDIFSLAVFGLQITIGHKKDEFTEHAMSVIEKSFFRDILASIGGEKRMPSKAEKYFKGFLAKKLHSSPEGSGYNNFIGMIMRVKGEIPVKNEKYVDASTNRFSDNAFPGTTAFEGDVELTDEIICDQILQFLTSGYDPIVSAITFALYDLSLASDHQGRVRSEITSCISKNNGFNYAAVEEMRLLDSCVHETLRLHPIVHTLTRSCVKDYITENELKIKSGDAIAISILGLHMDKQHFPEPEKFIPERFDKPDTMNTCFYMPFGRGQRKCIGSHFALLVIKVIVAKLVHHYKFNLSDRPENKVIHRYCGPYILPNGLTFRICPS